MRSQVPRKDFPLVPLVQHSKLKEVALDGGRQDNPSFAVDKHLAVLHGAEYAGSYASECCTAAEHNGSVPERLTPLPPKHQDAHGRQEGVAAIWSYAFLAAIWGSVGQ